MKITNETDWHGQHLRSLIKEALEADGMTTEGYRITVRYRGTDDNWYSGRGKYNRKWMKVFVPRPVRKVKKNNLRSDDEVATFEPKEVTFDEEHFAQVVRHEAGHNRGLKHEDMLSLSKLDVPFAEDHNVEVVSSYDVEARKEEIRSKRTKEEKRAEASYKIVCDECGKSKYLKTKTRAVKNAAKCLPIRSTCCDFIADLFVRDAEGEWELVAYGHEGQYVDNPQEWIDNPGELVAEAVA